MRDLIGRTIGHYRIVEKIGAGGMGEVYRAHDERLDRDVAIKVLHEAVAHDADRLARFEREARAVAKLDHANILAIHDFGSDQGVTYAVTELLDGHSLRQTIPASGMPWQKAVEIGAAIADGLATAHGKGIVHRDLKPENIFITSDGRVKVLDFGLARVKVPVEEDAETATLSPAGTVPGTVLGTIGYMSPEQLRGEPADARSDIFALGCVLYEMMSGRTAFLRNSTAETTVAILKEEPERITSSGAALPLDVERSIHRCLEKSPDARYQSSADLAFALRSISTERVVHPVTAAAEPPSGRRRRAAWVVGAAATVVVAAVTVWLQRPSPVTAPAAPDVPRIVVLPFENLGIPGDEYFADGVTEEITARIASVKGLQVISRTTALHFADTDKSIKEIGAELGVAYVLEGAVRWNRGPGVSRIRITPQLIRVDDDTHLWAEVYDRVIDDVFDVQLEIAQSVTDHLGVVLVGSERELVETQPTENVEAYQSFLRGRHFATRPHFTRENWDRAMAAYQQAVELDPDFGLAHAHLARGHALLRYLGHDLKPERLEAADAAAARAVELAPDSARVRLALANYRLWAHRDVEGALQELAFAGAGRPDNAEILETRGSIFILQGRWDEALDAYQRACELSPLDAGLLADNGLVLWITRRYPEAIAACDQAIMIAPDTLWPYLFKAFATWSWKGPAAPPRSILEAVPATAGSWERWAWYWQEIFDARYSDALERLESTHAGWIRIKVCARPASFFAAQAYALLGEHEMARESYESARALLELEVLESPDDPRLRGSLGIVYAALGRKEEAIREGTRATELLTRSMDGFYYIPYVIDLAHIYTIVGENEAALDQIEYLLANPSWISTPFLEMDPRWNPLRGHPRFRALLEDYARRTSVSDGRR